MKLSATTKKILVFGIGGALLIIGAVLGGVWPIIFKAILQWQLVLSESSSSFDMWKETPIPMYIDVFFFNWTNAQTFKDDPENTKPEFVEMGPYVFREHHTKINLSWNDNDTVTFQQVREWHFEPDLSEGTLEDAVTNINVIAVTVAHMVRHMNPLVQVLVNGILKKYEDLYITKSVRELMFDGYEDELLNLTSLLNVTEFKVPFDKFGWFYPRNNSPTYDGVFNMFTGASDVNQLGMLNAWNYDTHPPYYDDECGRAQGSTGELFPPGPEDDSVSIFAPELCSAIRLIKDEETVERLGIEGYRFYGDDSAFDNGTKYRYDRCFCMKNHISGPSGISTCTEDCVPSGVRGISKCRFGAPAFVSFPHFYLADPYYVNNIEGMRPNKSLHEFYLNLEQVTGIPLEVAARMQINVRLMSYNHSKLFKDMPTIFIPTLWFTQSAKLTDELGGMLKLLVNLPVIGMATFFGLAGIGALLLITGTVITIRNGWKGDEGDKLIVSDTFNTTAPSNSLKNEGASKEGINGLAE